MAATHEQGAVLVDAIEATLRPLLPLCRSFGVAHSDLSQMLARLFVYDTAETLKKENRPTTTARLGVMTGLTRGEVEKHLTERETVNRRRSLKTSEWVIPGIVLNHWNTDSRFSTPYGVPLDLSLSAESKSRSFAELVEASSPGTDSETVLDQLIASGCAEIHREGDFVRCTERAYVPTNVGTERIGQIGTVMGALGATLTRNVLGDGSTSYLERRVLSDFPISEGGRRSIHEWLTKNAVPFLETLDSWMTSTKEQLAAPEGQRVGVNIFMYDVHSDSDSLGAANINFSEVSTGSD